MYDLMCSVDAYDKQHVPMPSASSSGVGIPMINTSFKKEFNAIGHTINSLKIGFNYWMKTIRA